MSLFKINRGKAANLPEPTHDGYAYFTKDDGKFYIDAADDNGTIQRTCINPDNSYTLTPATTSALGGVKVGSNLTIASDGTLSGKEYTNATPTQAGLMSAADKTKLDGMATSTGKTNGVELTITTADWSSATTTVNGVDYYTYSTTSVTNIGNPHPTVVCSSASGVIPSTSEAAAFSCISFVTADTSTSKLTFYAKEKPTSSVVLIVKDYITESTASSTNSVTIAASDWSSSTTAVNGTSYYTAEKTVSGVSEEHPPVICNTASTSAVLPSAAEQTAYDYIDYTTVDTATNVVTFYAKNKPSATIIAMIV